MPKHPSLSQMQYYTYAIALILSSSEVILLYSRYKNEGLIYIAIAALSNRQLSFYTKYTQLNMHSSYDI